MLRLILSALLLVAPCSGTSAAEPTPTGNYDGAYRPQIHYSPPHGFMNDPNGMFKDAEGTYHLYYQLNPTGLVAGNQHWGHATSTDLYHWVNQPVAISPQRPGEGIFTGSAVIDGNNTSGFFPNQTNGVVAMYTLNTPSEQAQHIAYSRDGGYTFTEYSNNPVIAVGSTNFRDPKVVWHAPTSRWVVVIAYAVEYVVGIWTSPDLREWTHASNFSHAGFLGLQYECPNLVPMPMLRNGSLPLENLLDDSNIVTDADLWLMFISINPGAPLGGSISEYIPGYFNGTHFSPVDGAARLSDFAKDNYAGQFFSDLSANEPPTSIQWASNWQYTNDVPTASEGWRSVMALPRQHALANTTRTPYALFSIPPPLQHLYTTDQPLLSNNSLANRSVALEYGAINPSGVLSATITACSIPKQGPLGSVNFTFVSSTTGENIRGGYLIPGDSTFFLDRSGVHGYSNPLFTGQFSAAHPVDEDTGCFSMHIVIDRSIIEVFLDNGARSATAIFFAEGSMDVLIIGSSNVNETVTVGAEVWGLKSTWAQGNGSSNLGNTSQVVQRKVLDERWYR